MKLLKYIKIFFYILYFLWGYLLYSENNVVYNKIFVHNIGIGMQEGLLGWGDPWPIATQGPCEWTIDENFNFYILDEINNRLNIYDKKFNYIDQIMFIDEYVYGFIRAMNNMFVFASNKSIFKYDSNRNEVYRISNTKLSFKDFDYFYPYKDYVFYYTVDRKVEYLDASGNKHSTEEAIELMLEINEKYLTDKYRGAIQTGRYVIIDNKFYGFSLNEIEDVENLLPEVDNSDRTSLGMTVVKIFDKNLNLVEEIDYKDLFEKEKYPEFQDQYITPAIAPNGDIYFMRADADGVEFFKIENTWDPVVKANTLPDETQALVAAEIPPTLKKLLYSNYLTEPTNLNAYHPVKIFDGAEDTGWFEKSDGPGIGDYVGAEFENPVTIDGIEILPGWFDSRYWKQNNRIKKLQVELNDYSITVTCKDEMVPRRLSFADPKTFTKLKLTIKEVYPTTKWDDTPITEIRLYLDGEELEVDISRFKGNLEKLSEP